MKLRFTFILMCLSVLVHAQTLTQTLRGTVTDKTTQKALQGANLILQPGEIKTSTDEKGTFIFENTPAGRYSIRVSFTGYNTAIINEIIVATGKQTVINIELLPSVTMLSEASVSNANQDIEAVQSRTFTVEQSQRYAAVFNDAGRMAALYPGVALTDDGNNHISVHGNSPSTILWRLEGIDILNPNHLANGGTFSDRASPGGGGVLMLSSQMMDNSKFYTNPFDASYSNSSSGIFDMKIRKGNNQKREYTAQAGLIGLDFSGEGYFKKNKPASYLFNYRYSTVGLLEAMGVQFGDEAISFQDLSFNFSFPFKDESELTVFGIAGTNENIFKAKTDTAEWEVVKDSKDITYHSMLGILGLTYFKPLSANVVWRNSAAAQSLFIDREESNYSDQLTKLYTLDEKGTESRYSLHSYFNIALNAANLLTTGIQVNYIYNQYNDSYLNDTTGKEMSDLKTSVDGLIPSLYAEWKFIPGNKFQLTAGFNSNYFTYNSHFSFEPRATVAYQVCKKVNLAANYSYSTQQIAYKYYAYEPLLSDDKLKPYQSQYVSLIYTHQLLPNIQMRIEPYYQLLTDVPVNALIEDGYSVLNEMENLTYIQLKNSGKGISKGIDFSVQQYLSGSFYYLLSANAFDATYTGSDGNTYNRRFNSNYAFNVTTGYEFKSGAVSAKKIWGINLHYVYAGGMRQTPINVPESQQTGLTIFENNNYFTEQVSPYSRFDLRFTLRKNKASWNQLFALDIQNVLNTKNEAYNYWDSYQNQVVMKYQLGIIPNFSWKAEF